MFKNPVLEKSLIKDGFVKIPLLDMKDVENLMAFYDSHPPDFSYPFHSTPLSPDVEYKKEVNSVIQKILGFRLKEVFTNDYSFFFGSFTVKEASKDSEWNLHQDWTFVDEEKHYSLGVWVPLCDVNEENGCLSIVKRSHRFLHNVRGTNTFSEYSNISSFIKSGYLTPVPMKAGEAVLFLNSMLHYSSPNFTDKRRISVNCLMFPKKAQPYHFYHDNDWEWNEVEKFEISTETMITHNFLGAGKPLNSTSCGRTKLKTSAITEKEFVQAYRKYNGGVVERAIEIVRSVLH